jgi:hypothetical protein
MLAMEAPMTREERLEEALQDIMQLCTAYPLMQSKSPTGAELAKCRPMRSRPTSDKSIRNVTVVGVRRQYSKTR